MQEELILLLIKKEIEILEYYLPKQLTDFELEEIINSLIKDGSDKGAIMKYLKDNVAGQYDGKKAASIIDLLLK